MLLATKGDAGYWSDDWSSTSETQWFKSNKDCRLWCADITARMLEEGLVATNPDVEGIRAAMRSAGNPLKRREPTVHTLTAAVAQIRGLRLVQSMAPANHALRFGGYQIPDRVTGLLCDKFKEIACVYAWLPKPPWDETTPAWGPQEVAGHAVDVYGEDIFVGENGDLLWRALTETDHYGRSPLTETLDHPDLPTSPDLFVAAMLHDECAEYQLTTGLFAAAEDSKRARFCRTRLLSILKEALNPPSGVCYWTPEQQTKLRGFIDIVEAL